MPLSKLAGSNYATSYSKYYSIEQEVALFADPILNVTGCANASSQVDCLRSVDPFVLANLPEPARYLVVDGTYLVTDQLELTGNGLAAHVPVLMGFMRDDGASFITYPSANDTASSALLSNGFDLDSISTLNVFPEPTRNDATLNVFNTTSLISTDSGFRCLDEATAYSAVKHDVFERVCFYEFNRSYPLAVPSVIPSICEAPITDEFPYGDPSMEYFKCHSGELYYSFGILVYNGLPVRDQFDIPMSQFVLDSWTAFAKMGNPNPDVRFLEARGFVNTTRAVEASGAWKAVGGNDLTLELMQYPPVQEGFGIYGGQEQCQALGFLIDYYEAE
ncbi:hypothetical protein LTS18_004073 [Coniosporium uncinatum]|uniref:Uncharacterized protein n=1 Tax=Coniosporium uncinatum TaxID=93489 RepID=A0ACC3DSV0_9PEZI|nr:hypothetical protein LTS18_004073 [Coniosporium uncinatum]